VVSVILVCDALFYTFAESSENTFYHYWLKIEFMVFMANALSTVLFCISSFFFEIKSNINLEVSSTTRETDFLEANSKTNLFFGIYWVFPIVSLCHPLPESNI